MTSHETDLAWCAGFFDGEGHVSYKRSYPSRQTDTVSPMFMCSVPQASDNIEVLEFFKTTVGMGKIKGPYLTTRKSQYRLIFGINEVTDLFIMLKPYLKSRKTLDFQVAIMAFNTHSHEPTSDDYARLKKRDKKKGCPKCKADNWNGLHCLKCGYLV